ncbi:MAG: aminotransferase class III-fold pyridoxal phosphate-dependent enzyme [Chitinophagales bacterium]
MKPTVVQMEDDQFSIGRISRLAADHYGKEVRTTKLVGELDLNFLLSDQSGEQYVLKIAHAGENLLQLQMQNAIIRQLGDSGGRLLVQKIIPSSQGEEIVSLVQKDEGLRYMRLLTWIKGKPLAKFAPHSASLLFKVGAFCGNLCQVLKGFDHPGAHRFMKWDPSQAEWIRPHLDKFSGEQGAMVRYFYSQFEGFALPALKGIRKSINYNDANDYNILLTDASEETEVAGVIDFGDAVYTHTVNELAIAIAYATMNKPDPLEAATHIVSGFHSVFPLTEKEIRVLFPLITTRLLISVVCAELNRRDEPANEYLQISDGPAWDLLGKWRKTDSSFAEASFRQACGLIPSPKEEAFRKWIKENHSKYISPLAFEKPAWLDLSVGSIELGNARNLSDADALDNKITAMARSKICDIVLGKYNEARAIYSSPAFEQAGNNGPVWRTIHIGLDFFAAAGTPVKAALSGTIHSFANNNAERDYGPTIILEHRVSNELCFYALYGHLSEASLQNISAGKKVQAGEKIAEVGDRQANGNWTPHLHFQLIMDMLGQEGDFPGVCSPGEAPVWLSLCPDPWLLIKGEPSPQEKKISNEEILSFRRQHLGKNLSISYKEPIRIVRGDGPWLIDDMGRRYLDTVNNVAHVGHEHPRIVAAGQGQMAVLNTNTRYLHENLLKFVREILATLPSNLNVAFLVNSGSEANELALRIAKNYTGQTDMIVSEVGYHGNTNACVEISSYKFDGPGGKGRPPHIHVMPIPDIYRGLYRADDPDAGIKYASHVKQAIDEILSEKRKPAALIFESVISCGGQVELPDHFLKSAYEYTRTAGGVCIADEVQTGCGRAGDHFWAFEAHGVVPDIVTIGKPIGNGHPLGVVVTTQELADAFKNGMEYFNTFGGNPVSCAIGYEVLRVIREEGLQKNALEVGHYLKTGLRNLMMEFKVIGDVRGPGLFIGFELVKDRISKEPATNQAAYFINRMREMGILMSTDGPYNNVLKIKPPIVFTKTNSDFLLDSIEKVLKEDYMLPNN